MLRHAYAEVKDDDFRILVGQTWDVISPLNPGMLIYSVGWDGGNIGYRRAQFRGERYYAFSDVSLVTAQLSINPQVFADNTTTTTPAATLTGEPSNWPIVEGRVAWTVGHRGKDCLPIEIGLSGHIGEQEFIYSVGKLDELRRTWSGNLDVRVPITERLGVEGECFIGENLGTFLGGIGQGINPYTLNTIRDAGGWCEVWYDWTPRLHSHVGYSVDDPNDHDFAHYIGGKIYNQFYFGNLTYDVTKNFLVGTGSQFVEDDLCRPTAGRFGADRVRGEVRILVPQITIVRPPRPRFSQILGGLPIFPSKLLGVLPSQPPGDGRCRSSGTVWQTCG